MVNRGVMAQPYWWDEQWTISVQHTDADIDKHLSAFDDIAESLAKARRNAATAFRSQLHTNKQVLSRQSSAVRSVNADD